MRVTTLAGSLLRVGESVWFDEQHDLQGVVTRKTDKRILIAWREGNQVWYPKHLMWETVR